MEKYVPAYKLEAPKLLRILLFSYLFSNGDAHLKKVSLLETPMGDYRLSPAYDLLNSRIHAIDKEFALDDGLLPRNLAQGKIKHQFLILAKNVGLSKKTFSDTLSLISSNSNLVERMIGSSFLNETIN